MAFLALAVPLGSAAADFRATSEPATVLYDAPSARARPLFVYGRDVPVETLVSVEGWTKIRDAAGTIGWMPAKALSELSRLLQDQDEPVQMTFNAGKTQVLFKLKDVELVAQLIQGTFPDYSRLIPKEWSSRAVVEVRDFLQETKIASIFARDGSGIVRVTFQQGEDGTPGRMTVSARAEEIGDNQGELDAACEGEASKIAFNGKYLQDVLGVLDGGRVALETTGPSQPGVLRPVDNDNYVHVVMPMFVQW